MPEPYASILVSEGGTRLVDEASLWPTGQFVTTQLLVNKDFLDAHPDLVDDLVNGQIQANDYIKTSSDDAKQITATQIQTVTGGDPIPADVLDSAWTALTFTNDPLADTLLETTKHAQDTGLIDAVDGLSSIYNLDALNKQLTDAGAGAGLPYVPGRHASLG